MRPVTTALNTNSAKRFRLGYITKIVEYFKCFNLILFFKLLKLYFSINYIK
jgi:hypothetical protein